MPVVLRMYRAQSFNLETYLQHFRRRQGGLWGGAFNPEYDIDPAAPGIDASIRYESARGIARNRALANIIGAPADFADVHAIALRAQETGEWAYAPLVARPHETCVSKIIELVTVVAAPTGQTLVLTDTRWAGGTREYVDVVCTEANAVATTLSDAAAPGWYPRASANTIAYSRAIVRVLHAYAFGHTPTAADELLVAFTALPARQRPPAAWMLDGQADQVDAAIVAHQANADLTTIVRPLLKPRTRRRRVSIADAIMPSVPA